VLALTGSVFRLRGAGHATVGIHPFVKVILEIEDAATFDEFRATALTALHCHGLFSQARVGGGVFCVNPAVGVGEDFNGVEVSL
jgi:hypothetical protein